MTIASTIPLILPPTCASRFGGFHIGETMEQHQHHWLQIGENGTNECVICGERV